MHDFQASIKDHVDSAPLQVGEFRGLFSLGGRILDAVNKLRQQITLDDVAKKQLKDAALAVFDVAAKAIDIPLLPEPTEQSIEAWLRQLLAERIDVLLG